jgi:hypothetical protein
MADPYVESYTTYDIYRLSEMGHHLAATKIFKGTKHVFGN